MMDLPHQLRQQDTSMQYDVIVIGTGPGGEGAAMKACKDGKSVAVVEAYTEVGGGCTHWGTIPSKALRHVIQRYHEFRSHPLLMGGMDDSDVTLGALIRTADGVMKKQVSLRHGFYERNHVRILHGRARFIDANTVEVLQDNGGKEKITASGFVIATGSRPFRPADIDFTHPRIFDSDTILKLQETPQSMTIYGAGVVGCEYASMFRILGIKLNLINTRDNLLSFLDDEISDALSYHLRDQGVILRHGEEYERVEAVDDGVVLHLKSGKNRCAAVGQWSYRKFSGHGP